MEEIHEEIKEAVKQLETYKNRYRTMNTQDVIYMLKRLNENVKLTIPVVSVSLTEDEINKKARKFMSSGKTIGGGDSGWIESAYKQGCKDTLALVKGNER